MGRRGKKYNVGGVPWEPTCKECDDTGVCGKPFDCENCNGDGLVRKDTCPHCQKLDSKPGPPFRRLRCKRKDCHLGWTVDCPVRECIYGEIKEPCKSCSKGKAVKEKLERAMEAKALEFEKFGLEFLEKPAGVHGRTKFSFENDDDGNIDYRNVGTSYLDYLWTMCDRAGGEYLSDAFRNTKLGIEHAIHNLDSQRRHFHPFAIPEQGLARPFSLDILASCMPQPDNPRSALRRAHTGPT